MSFVARVVKNIARYSWPFLFFLKIKNLANEFSPVQNKGKTDTKKVYKRLAKYKKILILLSQNKGTFYITTKSKMVKIIRRPLTDINGRDFMTGKIVEAPVVEQGENLVQKVAKWQLKKQQEAQKAGRTDGKIHVDGFGWVTL